MLSTSGIFYLRCVLDFGDVCKLALFEVHLDVLPSKIKYHIVQISVTDLEVAVLIRKDQKLKVYFIRV